MLIILQVNLVSQKTCETSGNRSHSLLFLRREVRGKERHFTVRISLLFSKIRETHLGSYQYSKVCILSLLLSTLTSLVVDIDHDVVSCFCVERFCEDQVIFIPMPIVQGRN
jgi:hypothetical protein